MQRIVEPELMDDKAQAEAYANADFEQAEKLFLSTFQLYFPCQKIKGHMLDLGCGPGNISFQLANYFPNINVTGIDGSVEMIKLANERKKIELNSSDQVNFITSVLPSSAIPQKIYTSIVSNSLLHHLHHPEILWTTIKQYSSSNTKILIIDLFRPPCKEDALAIVNQYAANEPEVLQHDFYNSLLAAFTAKEIEQQLLNAGLTDLEMKTISDRHIAIFGIKTR
ncbi:MAG: methyltransferase domain-containing protein [Methylococcales bacterium]|nr:methyltransferase domain-containing protein [Methylococcales bacterium]